MCNTNSFNSLVSETLDKFSNVPECGFVHDTDAYSVKKDQVMYLIRTFLCFALKRVVSGSLLACTQESNTATIKGQLPRGH